MKGSSLREKKPHPMMQLRNHPLAKIFVISNQEGQKKNRRRQQNKHQRVDYCFLFYSRREPSFHFSFNSWCNI
jgi:hypothetical protein